MDWIRQSGSRQQLGPGIECLISPDGSTLAVLQMRMADEIEMRFDLVLMDPASGAITNIVQENAEVEGFMFAADTNRLLYTTQAADGVSEDYPFALLSFERGGEPQLLCTSRTERIAASPVPNQLYFMYMLTTGQETKMLRPITYVWNIA